MGKQEQPQQREVPRVVLKVNSAVKARRDPVRKDENLNEVETSC